MVLSMGVFDVELEIGSIFTELIIEK